MEAKQAIELINTFESRTTKVVNAVNSGRGCGGAFKKQVATAIQIFTEITGRAPTTEEISQLCQ